MAILIEESWKKQLEDEFSKDYFKNLTKFVRSEYLNSKVYPPAKLIFNAFNLCPFNNIKVVILGQDPYHRDGQAHGLSFSVPKGVSIPPSLLNIFKEIKTDLSIKDFIPQDGNLEYLAKQGVLLLNSTLTVRAGQPGSHQKMGWEEFTDSVIKIISDKKTRVVFVLWGRFAREKKNLIDSNKHLILESAHPSPFSAHLFFGCKHFSKTNNYLAKNGIKLIRWVE